MPSGDPLAKLAGGGFLREVLARGCVEHEAITGEREGAEGVDKANFLFGLSKLR